jgi:hypothetical protein
MIFVRGAAAYSRNSACTGTGRFFGRSGLEPVALV